MNSITIVEPELIERIDLNILSCKAHDVLVKVDSISLCGSDVHLYYGTYNGPKNYPINFGHEWSGIVSAVGADVTGLKPGDKVTGDCSKYCGECELCAVDKNLCSTIDKYGITLDGSSSEYIIRDERYLYKLPNDLDITLGAIVEPLAVGAHLLKKMLSKFAWDEDTSVLVVGAGGIGTGIVYLLKYLYHLNHVYTRDLSAFREAQAEALGAEVFSRDKENSILYEDDYRSLYQTNGFDIVIDTTGSAEVFRQCLYWVNPNGVIGILGMIPEITFKLKLVVLKSLCIVGSIGGTGDFEDVIACLQKYPEPAKKIITHTFPSDNESIKKAFKLNKDSQNALKIQIRLSE